MLKALLLMPVLGALLLGLLPSRLVRWQWPLALIFALLSAALAGVLVWRFDHAGETIQFFESRAWNARLGSSFALGVDGISVVMLMLTAGLTLAAVLISRNMARAGRLYYVLLMLLESAMFGVFSARDWSLFYVFWEATLLPLFFLIDRLGGENRQRAALNFFLYTLGGSVFMLVALLFLYDAAPGHSFAMLDMAEGGRSLSPGMQLLIFAGLFIGFAVKMPVVPLHGWLPLAHVEAPGPVSLLLSGVLLKMGAYGLIRALETLPLAFAQMQGWLALLGFVSLLYGALLSWRQQDLKAMVAYASIAHMGLVLLGIVTMNANGLRGALLQMVAHGLAAGLLFLLVGALYERTHSRNLSDYAGVARQLPRYAVALAFALLAAVGLPGSAGFIAEIHVLIGGWPLWSGWLVLLGVAMLVGAAAALRVIGVCYRKDLPLSTGVLVSRDMQLSERLAALGLALPIVVLGIWPQPLLSVLDHGVRQLIAQVAR
ncbi:MAG: NADH-quinone oxidoreductase subunit M [Azonexus sp.]|nr:NADH-quinone oxidoreductase subunit M [Azonexus sp.]